MVISDLVHRLEIKQDEDKTGAVVLIKEMAPLGFFENMMPEDKTPFGYVAVAGMETAKLIAYGVLAYKIIETVTR